MSDLQIDVTVRRSAFELQARAVFEPGVTVLFGPSGAGKSTLLDVVAGLVPPDAGSVRLGDRVLDDRARRVHVAARARRIGYVVQGLALFPHRDVMDNVTYGLASLRRPEARDRGARLLDRLGIPNLASRLPSSLSGGEKQRVAIARALAIEPSVLLLDEPFAALDRPRRRDLLSLVRELVAERSIPALFVTHDQEEAEAIGSRVVVLEAGRIVAQGSPIEVLEAPSRWAVAHADAMDNAFDAVVVARREREGALEVRAGEVTFLARPAEFGDGHAVTLAVRASDVIVSLDAPGRISAANVLRGKVASIKSVGRAVIVTIDCGVSLRAELTPAGCDRLELAPGREVWALVKARACHVFPRERAVTPAVDRAGR